MMRLGILALLCFALVSARTGFSEDGEKVLFHVTAVSSGEAQDWCPTGKCSATRLTVEGYTDSVEYVLQCVEVIANEPSPHFTVVCERVHSHNDYMATLGADYIFFGEKHSHVEGEPSHAAYQIVSEKEKKRSQ